VPEDLGISKGLWQRVSELVSGGTEPRLIRPMGIAVDEGQVVYVADPGAQAVHRFDRSRGRYDLIHREDGRKLPSPVAVAVGPEGEAYAVDSILGQLFVIHRGSTKAVSLTLGAELVRPSGVAVDRSTGQVYVADTGAHQVKVFAPDGSLRSTFGRRGEADGLFNYPTSIWWDSTGRLLVADSLNFRVQIFDAGGRFLGKIGSLGDGTGYLSRPKGVAVDGSGHIYVVDTLFHAVQIFDAGGAFLLHFGDQGTGRGQFWLPAGICIGEGDTIYVADSHNQRVQIFRYIGGAH
jgi:DNA-binding beta-propeller fold protein YncE